MGCHAWAKASLHNRESWLRARVVLNGDEISHDMLRNPDVVSLGSAAGRLASREQYPALFIFTTVV